MPIENAFSKIKALLKKVQADTQEALSHAIKAACHVITLQDVLGWFKYCGYLDVQSQGVVVRVCLI